jgi:hypothetical protein
MNMLILGWTTKHYRGESIDAALWSNDDTAELREKAANYIAVYSLDNGIVMSYPRSMKLAEAKALTVHFLANTTGARK